MKLIKIDDLFSFEKGVLQSSKCTLGEFDFITASSDWKTHNEYTHDCEALVFAAAASGSLGRTHYVNGKFISSDLCFIITPKDPLNLPIDLKFYHLIFNEFKNDIVKNTKAGTSKEAIGLKSFGNYKLPYFDISKQIEAKEQFVDLQLSKLELNNQFITQLSLVKQLRQAFLSEAMQGKLICQSEPVEYQETGQQLLARIKAEKAQLIKDKKLKKEKELPPIKPEEIPFEIPKDWVWCKLGDIFQIVRGSSPRPKGDPRYFSKDRTPYHWITIADFKKNGKKNILVDTDQFLTEEGSKQSRIVTNKDLLVAASGVGSVGKSSEVGITGFIYDGIMAIKNISDRALLKYIAQYLKVKELEIYSIASGANWLNINTDLLNNYIMPLPPLSVVKKIVAKLDKLMKTCDDLENSIKQSQLQNEQLLQQVLKEALEVRETVTIDTVLAQPKIVELNPAALNLDNLVAEPFEKYVAKPINNIQDGDLEMALMIACMKNKLGVTYGDVGLQKNVYNTNNLYPVFSKQYQFLNSNFGTYSPELKEDLKKNPYLITQKVAGNKEVYTINPKYNSQILDKLTAPENKGFVQAINRMLSIYEHPFINKETDKIELYNTVLKLSLDKNTQDIEVIYQGMKDWEIKQTKYKTKAEKFSKDNSKKMLELLVDNVFNTQIDN